MTERRSNLSAQLGQEVIYLIMAIAVAGLLFVLPFVSPTIFNEREPPIIVLREADGYTFETGKAAPPPAFAANFKKNILPRIDDESRKSGATIIEVIGHTDEVPIRVSQRRDANLDFTLGPYLQGRTGKAPVPADNIGLGMARAVAVARLLRAQGIGQGYVIIPMSAGPFQRLDDSASSLASAVPDRDRRRIEIRLRRRKER